jgi:hypothetical protein
MHRFGVVVEIIAYTLYARGRGIGRGRWKSGCLPVDHTITTASDETVRRWGSPARAPCSLASALR